VKDYQEKLLAATIPILSGLLASGHFTTGGVGKDLNGDPIDLDIGVERVDNGPTWKEDGFIVRRSSLAVEEAIALARELFATIREEDEA
jgi:hypothetical protein